MRKPLLVLLGSLVIVTAAAAAPDRRALKYAPVIEAVRTDPAQLKLRADAGDAIAQYAMAIRAHYGFEGLPDPLAMIEWSRKALASRGSVPMTTYMAGLNGAPGHISIISVPNPGLAYSIASASDTCAIALDSAGKATNTAKACGTPELYAELLALWPKPFKPRVLTASPDAIECEPRELDEVWSLAARSFNARQFDEARKASDVIIKACGEAAPSWYPRVLRAELALADKDAALALRLLAPVPKPSPPPIGSYSSFVAMAALQAAGDKAGFKRERDTLIDQVSAALIGPMSFGGRQVERFVVSGAEVRGYEIVHVLGGQLIASAIFVIKPPVDDGWPVTIMLTSSPNEVKAGERSYFLDEFHCQEKWTLKYFDGKADYRAARALVVERLEGKLEPSSGSRMGALSSCRNSIVVAPGLGG